MTLRDVVVSSGFEKLTGEVGLDREVTGGYSSDLLSDVVANSMRGDLWVTLQTHPNVVAVATLKELAGIVFVNGRKPDADTLSRALEQGVPLLATSLPAFELVGRLYEAGIRRKA
ncbi:MAG: serine kinase [Bryobacteraceae bacterium]